MAAVAIGLIGAAVVGSGATLWATSMSSDAADRASRIQSEENRRVEMLRIRFAREESEREMFRFKEGQRESRRQFNLGLEQRGKEASLQESQFARTHELQKEQVEIDKTQILHDNRNAMRNNVQNLFANNHNLRMNFANYYSRRA